MVDSFPFESLKHLHQTTFEILKYLKQKMFFETTHSSKNLQNFLHQKVDQNVTILGLLNLKKEFAWGLKK